MSARWWPSSRHDATDRTGRSPGRSGLLPRHPHRSAWRARTGRPWCRAREPDTWSVPSAHGESVVLAHPAGFDDCNGDPHGGREMPPAETRGKIHHTVSGTGMPTLRPARRSLPRDDNALGERAPMTAALQNHGCTGRHAVNDQRTSLGIGRRVVKGPLHRGLERAERLHCDGHGARGRPSKAGIASVGRRDEVNTELLICDRAGGGRGGSQRLAET